MEKNNVTKKQEAINMLSRQLIQAQYEVDEFQGLTSSLTEKLNEAYAALTLADSNKKQALSNKNMLDQLVQNAFDLKKISTSVFNNISLSSSQTKNLAIEVKQLLTELKSSVAEINKLAQLVIRKKSINPLISDELISIINTAITDSSNAISLTLVALKSIITTQSLNTKSKTATDLENKLAGQFYSLLTGTTAVKKKNGKRNDSLRSLMYESYTQSKTTYTQTYKSSVNITKQLNTANLGLNKAQVKQQSLQAAFVAAQAASLAT